MNFCSECNKPIPDQKGMEGKLNNIKRSICDDCKPAVFQDIKDAFDERDEQRKKELKKMRDNLNIIPMVGDVVLVEGVSLKGKNRIETHGSVWKVKKVWGQKSMVESMAEPRFENDPLHPGLRWIDGPDDKDFKIVNIWEGNAKRYKTISV